MGDPMTPVTTCERESNDLEKTRYLIFLEFLISTMCNHNTGSFLSNDSDHQLVRKQRLQLRNNKRERCKKMMKIKLEK